MASFPMDVPGKWIKVIKDKSTLYSKNKGEMIRSPPKVKC